MVKLAKSFIASNVKAPEWQLFVPKSYTTLRQGYTGQDFRNDLIAGLTVAIVALPLAMALAIASGTTPDKGLVTVVIAGFLISFLGGSRFQIGGPTGAFVVVVFNVIAQHGYDGLVLATFMAGLMLVVAGYARLGTWIKYIPQPVVTGFTAGIAVIIFSSQIRDLFGLQIEKVPGDFIEKYEAFWQARNSLNLAALAISGGALLLIVALRRYAPKLPAFLLAVLAASFAVYAFHIPVNTIGSAFGEIPRGLPAPHWPEISIGRMRELLPSAFTIAFLAGVESLLSAVVADGMTGRRHRSNCELVAQGIANFFSALFGGLPATGAIARTATNIRSGAKSPVSGMIHAVFVLLFMMAFAPLASYIPLAALAAVLVIVAWNMSEIDKFRALLRASRGDKLVLVITFLLTVLVDLTVAIEVGVVLAAILFMHRMSEAVEMNTDLSIFEQDQNDFLRTPGGDPFTMRAELPSDVEAFQVRGPLFFGVATRLIDAVDQLNPVPKVFILRLSQVPLIDSSGVVALEEFIKRCRRKHIAVIFSGGSQRVLGIMRRSGLMEPQEGVYFAENFHASIEKSRILLQDIQRQG